MDYIQRPVFDDFSGQIAHYSNRLNVASQQLDDAFKNLQEIEILAGDGWKSRAGDATISKAQELRLGIKNSSQTIEESLYDLQKLSNAIAIEIDRMMKEWEQENLPKNNDINM